MQHLGAKLCIKLTFFFPIVRYVRHLDTTVLTLHIKTKLCQLVEAMMNRRDDLSFRQEMKFRNKLVEYLTDWVMGNSHQISPPGSGDATALTRDLDEACMHAVGKQNYWFKILPLDGYCLGVRKRTVYLIF